MSYQRLILAVFGDTHAGHKLGLINPETELQIEQSSGEIVYAHPDLNEPQKYLWNLYAEKHIPEIIKLAGNDEVIPIHLGDISQGTKYIAELVSTRISDHIMIGYYNMKPWLQYPNIKRMRLVKGTSSHEFGEGSSSLIVEKLLKQDKSELDIKTLYHGLVTISDVKIDYAHHGPGTGIRVWLNGDEVRRYIRNIVLGEVLIGKSPANIILRAHVHSPIAEYLKVGDYAVWGVVVPSYCLIGDYAHKATKSINFVFNGMSAIEIIKYDSGRFTIYPHWFMNRLDVRTKEEINYGSN